jgi:hypothetical protein
MIHTLFRSVNYMTTDVLPTSHSTRATAITNEFHLIQCNVREKVLEAITPIYHSTDTWTLSNDIKFRPIDARCIGVDLELRKALITFVEVEAGHRVEEAAKHSLR